MKRALILVDLQHDYFPGGRWVLSGVDAAAKNAAKLLAAARASKDLIIHVRHEALTSDAPFFAPGSRGAEIHSSVANLAGEPVVLKNYPNSFRKTDLQDLLKKNNIEHIVICGAMSHVCIDAVTREASDRGYSCTVVHDACATRDVEFEGIHVPAEHVHAAFMAALRFGYATVVSTDEFFAR